MREKKKREKKKWNGSSISAFLFSARDNLRFDRDTYDILQGEARWMKKEETDWSKRCALAHCVCVGVCVPAQRAVNTTQYTSRNGDINKKKGTNNKRTTTVE